MRPNIRTAAGRAAEAGGADELDEGAGMARRLQPGYRAWKRQ
jgi:hypothetical protein